MLLPGNFIYQMSSWTRAIVIPLSIVHAMNPQRPVPAGFNLQELFLPGESARSAGQDQLVHLAQFLPALDRVVEVLGTVRLEERPQQRHPPGRAVDAGAYEVHRRAGARSIRR